MEGDRSVTVGRCVRRNFYPRPPGGGRLFNPEGLVSAEQFLSTPSGWRATRPQMCLSPARRISIHALRVEGDPMTLSHGLRSTIFLSTPSGWRATKIRLQELEIEIVFLSTPSGWRATSTGTCSPRSCRDFYPRPPGGGRRPGRDPGCRQHPHFYPRPPGGGRPRRLKKVWGQYTLFLSTPSGWRATNRQFPHVDGCSNFYPRPPGGGRPLTIMSTARGN